MVPHAHPARFALLAAAALLIPGGVAAEEPAEWERDAPPALFYVSPEDADGYPTHVVLRVVDGITGEGIHGATAALVSQFEYPETALAMPDRTGIADADGWLRIRADDLGWGTAWMSTYWKYVEAAGYAGGVVRPDENAGEVRLFRARNVVVEVRDFLDRPVGGAVIGARGQSTCGHMPDQRLVTTDMEGRAVLPDVGPPGDGDASPGWECWAVADGILSLYYDVEVPLLQGPPQVLRYDGSRPIEGTVLDAEGRPVAGAYVGTYGFHRGPWTRTDAAGCFRLVGALPFCDVSVVPPGFEVGTPGPRPPQFTAPPPGVRRTFRLPLKGPSAPEPATWPVSYVFVDARTKQEIEDMVPRMAVRDADGTTIVNERYDAGTLQRLPTGTWTVTAGFWAWAESRVRVDVTDGPPPPVRFEMERNPQVRFVLEGDLANTSVSLVSEIDERSLDEDELALGSVPVPAQGECGFRLTCLLSGPGPDRILTRIVPVPPDRGRPDAPPLRLRPPARWTVRARLVGPEGKPAPGWITADVNGALPAWTYYEHVDSKSPASDEPQAEMDPRWSPFLLALAEDRSLAPRVVPLSTPEGAPDEAVIDAGEIRLFRRGDPRLVVLGRDGKPRPRIDVRIIHDAVARHEYTSDEGTIDPRLLPLAVGDVVEVDDARIDLAEDKQAARPIRMRLEGSGPWTLRDDRPPTSIVVEATDESGKRIGTTLVVDGRAYEGPSYADEKRVYPPFEVVGFDPGPHRVAVSAANRLTRLYRIILEAGERRVLKPRLNPVSSAKPPK